MLTFHKNWIFTLLVVGALLTIAGCGRNRVDASLLPTDVPTLSSDLPTAAQPVAKATNTSEPTLAPTEVPTVTTEPTASEVVSETATVTEVATVVDGAAQPESPLVAEIEATAAPTATATLAVSITLTPTMAPTKTLSPTVTTEVEVAATITPTIRATATLMMTTTVPISAVQPITTAANLTTTQTVTDGTINGNDEALTGLPAAVAAGLKDADPANGQLLSTKNACIGCHSLDEGVKLVGPSWYGLAGRAGEQVVGQSAEEYLYTSIVKPNEHLVEGYPAGLMLQIYEDTLSDQDKADVIAYLMTLMGK